MVAKSHFFFSLMILAVCVLSPWEGRAQDRTKGKPSEQTAARPAEIQGTIKVSGAWALYPMMVKWSEEFRRGNPKVRIDVSAGGAGKGVADALAGLVDLGMVSREITPEEVKQGAVYVPVVKDAVFPVMNSANPAFAKGISLKGIRRQVFVDLWIKEKPLTWGDLAGTPARDKVNVYTRSDACGAAETWALYLGKKQEDLQGVGVYGDPGLAEAVRRDVSGIGYNNLNYAYDYKTGLPLEGLKVVPIDVNENGKIDPDEDLSVKEKGVRAVAAGKYPSPPARPLYLQARGRFRGPAKEFIRWILTEGQKYVDENGYVRLGGPQIAEAVRTLEK